MPGKAVVASVSDLADDLGRLRDMLATAVTTARIVVTPERVVVAEAQRTLAYLALYGYAVDAVLVNRALRPELMTETLRPWFVAQDAQMKAISTAFAPLPQLVTAHRMVEPVGQGCLTDLGRELYRDLDPLAELAPHAPLQITASGDQSMVRVPVHGVDRDEIRLDRWGDDLVVTLGMHRRKVRLPDMLRGQAVVRAGLNDGHLEVVFGEVAHVG
jgi:arsenite-transporting ATPase